MARSQVIIVFALLSLFLSSASATITYSNISTSFQCNPSLFFNGGNSVLCQPQDDYYVAVNLSSPAVGQEFYVCNPSVDPYFDPVTQNVVCLGAPGTYTNGTNYYNLYTVNPFSSGYQKSTQSYPATFTRFKQGYLLMAVESSNPNNSFINAVVFSTSATGTAPTPYCSFSVPNYTEVEDFTILASKNLFFVLALMSNGSYDVLYINCTTGAGNVTTNFYQPPANNSLYTTYGGIDLFYGLGATPFLLVFDPNFPQPVSLTTLGTQNNATNININSRSIKKIVPINATTFVTYTTCMVVMYTFNSTITANLVGEFNFGCWYFKVQYNAFQSLLYVDDGINYFFLNISTFTLYNVYSLNPTIPLANGSNIYLDRNGYFVQSGSNITFTAIGLAFQPYTFYVVPPYTTYYMLGTRAGGKTFLITVDVTISNITEIQLPSSLVPLIDQKIYAVASADPNNLIFAASSSQSPSSMILWCNNASSNQDNPKGAIPFINTNNCTISLVSANTAQFKYNETVYATTSGSTIKLVDVNSGSTLQSVQTTIDNSIINDCNWGAFDAVPTPGSTVIVNGFFASCGPEGSENFLISEGGTNTPLPGTAEGFIQIFANNSFQYCVPTADFPEVNNCQLSNVTSWGSVTPVPGPNSSGGGAWVVILLLLLALGGGGAYYWFYYRPRHMIKYSGQPDNYQPFARGGNTSIEHASD